jgi:hypothetical protein
MNRALDAFGRLICLDLPRRITPLSAWHEHIPFALNLVAVAKPSVIVELGTHAGDSFCAMCQAVETERLPTRCFAVDTWKGDEQAGYYGPEILADLRAHHDPLYGGFSRLVQSTIEDALGQFAPGSIDLLHVDALHTYEAVRGDVEAWLPKMSSSGVVMLHDIAVREDGFGVWRFWEEIKERYPHFEFTHGSGLGLVAVGEDGLPTLEPLFGASEEDAAGVRRFFQELGRRLELVEDLRREREAVAVLRAAVADRDRRLAEDASALESLRAQTEAEIAAVAAKAEMTIAQAEAAAARAARDRDATQAALMECQARLASIEGSRGFRALRNLWLLRDTMAPPGSMRRDIITRLTRNGRPRGR